MMRPAHDSAPAATPAVGDGLHVTTPRGARQAFPREEFDARIARVQHDMAARGIDVLLVHTPENICYLTGYETSGYFEYQVLAVPVTGAPRMLVRNVEQLNVDEYTWHADAFVWRDGTDYFEATGRLVDQLDVARPARVGLELHSWFVTARVSAALAAELSGDEIVDAGRLVETRRLVKSPAEQVYVRAAAEIADRTMAAAIAAAGAGRTELDVAAAAYRENILAGSEYPALPHYISSGTRSEVGHATWSDKVLEDGDMLKLEFLGVKRRYHAGLTRPVHIGRPPARIRDQVDIAREFQREVFAELRPGASVSDIVVRARERQAARLGRPPVKLRLGYSMGIGFPPIAGESQTADFREGAPWILAAGMVFHMLSVVSIDCTLSDTILITPEGYEKLTRTSGELADV
jgi:Xaa-Pro dipeptidase